MHQKQGLTFQPKPWPVLGAMDLGIADDGERSGHEQAAQIAITSFADNCRACPYPPLECCFGTMPIQAEKLRPDRRTSRVGNSSDQGSGQCWTDARDIARAAGSPGWIVPGHDHAIELQMLCLQHPQLGTEAATHARATSGNHLSSASATTPSSSSSTMASDRRDDPELGKMGADGIDHRSLLADEQMTGTMQRQATLLSGVSWLDCMF